MIRGYGARLQWSEIDDAYVATCPEFPGLVGVDADAAEALAELREALEMAVEVLEEDGAALPEPRTVVEHSGQFRLRVAKSLHARLAELAADEGVSLNSFVSSVLAHAAGVADGRRESMPASEPGTRAVRRPGPGTRPRKKASGST